MLILVAIAIVAVYSGGVRSVGIIGAIIAVLASVLAIRIIDRIRAILTSILPIWVVDRVRIVWICAQIAKILSGFPIS